MFSYHPPIEIEVSFNSLTSLEENNLNLIYDYSKADWLGLNDFSYWD